MKKSPLLKTALAGIACIAFVPLVGCEEKGPMEEAGEKVDEAVEEVADEVDDATN